MLKKCVLEEKMLWIFPDHPFFFFPSLSLFSNSHLSPLPNHSPYWKGILDWVVVVIVVERTFSTFTFDHGQSSHNDSQLSSWYILILFHLSIRGIKNSLPSHIFLPLFFIEHPSFYLHSYTHKRTVIQKGSKKEFKCEGPEWKGEGRS